MPNIKPEGLKVLGAVLATPMNVDPIRKLQIAKIILAQALHESGNFTGGAFKKNNNVFGMKMPRVRKSPFIAGPGSQPPANEGATPYAKFNSIEYSVFDLFHWLVQWNDFSFDIFNSVGDYSIFVNKHGFSGSTPQQYALAMGRHYEVIKDVEQKDIPAVTVEGKALSFMDKVKEYLKKKWWQPALIVASLYLMFKYAFNSSNSKRY